MHNEKEIRCRIRRKNKVKQGIYQVQNEKEKKKSNKRLVQSKSASGIRLF